MITLWGSFIVWRFSVVIDRIPYSGVVFQSVNRNFGCR